MLSLFRRRKPDTRSPLVRRVRDLEIASARLIRAGFAGDYHSAFHGRGIEFSQVREYQPGDDIRTIDWNVTARSGTPHVKQFVEERDLTILIAVDISASMSFGSVDWRKSDIAAELASVFAFSAVENADRVGLLLFSDRVHKYIAPRRGRPHAQVIVRAAAEPGLRGHDGAAQPLRPDSSLPLGMTPSDGSASTRGLIGSFRAAETARNLGGGQSTGDKTDLESAARFLERISAKRAVVILISDFLDVNFERPLNRLNRKHDVIAIDITDPREERFPESGLIRVVDAESGAARWVDARKSDVARIAAQRRIQLERRFRASGVDWMSVSTAVPYDRDLLRFFRQRIFRTT